MILKMEDIETRILVIRGEKVLIDADVAEIYGVETKRVNEAVKNNLDKFPIDYLFALGQDEKDELVENFDRFGRLKHSTAIPKGFTEKGLYMLATILKSKQATETTFAIIETFARIRQLSRNLNQLTKTNNEIQQKALMQKSGEIIAEVLGEGLVATDTDHLRRGTAWGSLQNAARRARRAGASEANDGGIKCGVFESQAHHQEKDEMTKATMLQDGAKTIKKHIVPLPEIPLEWKRETRSQEEKIEKKLLQMGFTPMTPEMRSLLIAAGHYGMPSE